MTDKLELDDWIKGMISDENRFHKFYSRENTSVNIYIFFISNGSTDMSTVSNVLYIEKHKVELENGIITWDKLSEIIVQYKNYKGNKYTDPKIGVYNIDMSTKQDVIEFIHSLEMTDNSDDDVDNNDDAGDNSNETDKHSEEEMFKYWKFVKLYKDIRFKDSIEMFGNLNSIYMFFTEDNSNL